MIFVGFFHSKKEVSYPYKLFIALKYYLDLINEPQLEISNVDEIMSPEFSPVTKSRRKLKATVSSTASVEEVDFNAVKIKIPVCAKNNEKLFMPCFVQMNHWSDKPN